ncbi:MAG TPA: Sir2 family NAD-dependent protein deacetylase [Luteibaculaceae bacterium]|nr:Sir2 family NAD-dependent protein deacetylase [Luteibaculaceae bacterium]
MERKHLVVLSGAGISAESGLKTFRDSDGLWENYNVYEVATPEAWDANPSLVLQFYNERRDQVCKASPNKGHTLLALLDDYFDCTIITQNIDDLHERAGSEKVLHLHGEIMNARSSVNETAVYRLKPGAHIHMGDRCEWGSQLRPDVVWFGEAVTQLEPAAQIVAQADIIVIVGTSLNVYPAAGLVQYSQPEAKIYLIDPQDVYVPYLDHRVVKILKKASEGCEILLNLLLKNA